MPDVFISYKHRLRDRVAELAEAMRALGLDVWFDEGLTSGDDYAGAISEQLRAARCVIVVWSPDVFPPHDKHGWVRGEAQKGRERDVLVAVMLEPTDLDPPWNTVQFENLVEWTADTADRTSWRRTLRAIGGLVGRPGLAEFDRAQSAGTATALTDWAREFSEDPLVPAVWQQIEELEIAATRERLKVERERKPTPVNGAKAAPPKPRKAPQPQPTMAEAAAVLMADVAETPAVEPAPAPRPKPRQSAATSALRWPFLAAAVAINIAGALASIYVVGETGIATTGIVTLLGGPVATGLVLAAGLLLMRLVRWPGALVFIAAMGVGYAVAMTAMFGVFSVFPYSSGRQLLLELCSGLALSGISLACALAGVAFIARDRVGRRTVMKVLVTGVVTGLAIGACAMFGPFGIRNPAPPALGLAALWQIGFGAGVFWLFGRSQPRAASTM